MTGHALLVFANLYCLCYVREWCQHGFLSLIAADPGLPWLIYAQYSFGW